VLSDDPAVLKIRVKQLEEEVRRLRTEKDILKKATAFFAREQP
jgi:transposase-like protein